MADLLDQDEYWITADQVRIPLEEMDDSHRRNVLNLLVRRAPYTMKMYYLKESQLMWDAPDDVFHQWSAEAMQEINDSPEQWIERRPLIKKLRQLVEHDGAVDGEVVLNMIEGRIHAQS
jgi:hypothetical protein